MIVKIQQSINTTADNSQMLIYNEDRSFFFEDDLSPVVKELLGAEPKKYFYAEINKANGLEIHQEAPEQEW